MNEFSQSVIEQINYYVYILFDPATDEVFYIGKGKGNRVFEHLKCAITTPLQSDKLEKIRGINSRGMQVKHVVLRHGLTEKEAFEIEAALIDFVGLQDLTNVVNGKHSGFRGLMNVSEVESLYAAPDIVICEPSILIIVNKLYEYGISPEKLFEITCGNWPLGERRKNARYAFSIYQGIVREVYEIDDWFPVKARSKDQKKQDRWRFTGNVAQNLQHYVGGSVEKYLTQGAQFPIRYINC